MTDFYNLCLAWNCEHDGDFVRLLETACQREGLSLLNITPASLDALLPAVQAEQVRFGAFLDRAVDDDDRFLPLEESVYTQNIIRLNPYWLARQAWDKAWMDQKFRWAGLCTPDALVIPAFQVQADLPCPDLSRFGGHFVIKPVHGGGGKGVVTHASSWDQVLAARQTFPADRYLIQAYIHPAALDGRPAWFRMLYSAGEIYPCWWDPHTHVYTPLHAGDEDRLGLQPLRDMTGAISRICQLDLFSTEITLDSAGNLTIIDPVNDPIDLRLQSRTPDGMPDEIAWAIAQNIVQVACPVLSYLPV